MSAFVQGTTAHSNGASPSVAFTSNVAANNLILGSVAHFLTDRTVSALSSNNGSLTLRTEVLNTGNCGLRNGYGIAASSAACTISGTITLIADYAIGCAEYSGITSTPFDVGASGVGSSSPYSTGTTATTAQANERVVAIATYGITSTGIVPSATGFSNDVLLNDSTNMPLVMMSKAVSAIGTQTASITWENGVYAAEILTFNESVGGATSPFPPWPQFINTLVRM